MWSTEAAVSAHGGDQYMGRPPLTLRRVDVSAGIVWMLDWTTARRFGDGSPLRSLGAEHRMSAEAKLSRLI